MKIFCPGRDRLQLVSPALRAQRRTLHSTRGGEKGDTGRARGFLERSAPEPGPEACTVGPRQQQLNPQSPLPPINLPSGRTPSQSAQSPWVKPEPVECGTPLVGPPRVLHVLQGRELGHSASRPRKKAALQSRFKYVDGDSISIVVLQMHDSLNIVSPRQL